MDPVQKERVLKTEYWGLIPYWAKNPKIAYYTSNAVGETITTKASFKRAFKKMRGLVMMDGFYEWDRSVKPSQPYYFCMKDGEPFACAGLYESWKVRNDPDPRDLEKMEKTGKAPKPAEWPLKIGDDSFNPKDVLESCTIITTQANDLMAKIHDRMPVILDEKNWDAWLDPQLQDEGILKGFLRPYPSEKMQCWPVKALKDDGPSLIKKIKI